jgi:uncharacterized membrane protein
VNPIEVDENGVVANGIHRARTAVMIYIAGDPLAMDDQLFDAIAYFGSVGGWSTRMLKGRTAMRRQALAQAEASGHPLPELTLRLHRARRYLVWRGMR